MYGQRSDCARHGDGVLYECLPGYFQSLCGALASLGLAAAQSIAPDEIHSHTVPYVPPQAIALRTEVRVVEVPVVVRDGFLHAVSGLTRDDFEIYDNAKKQEITGFSVENFTPLGDAAVAAATGAPSKGPPRLRFLALCFDDLHLLPVFVTRVKDEAERFVRTSLAPGDRAVVVRTSRSEDAQFTGDVPTLIAQIEKVTPFVPAVPDDSERCPHIDPREAYQIAEHMDPGNQVLHAKEAECNACYNHPCPEGQVTSMAHVIWAHTRSSTVNALSVIDSMVDGMAKLPGQRVILLASGGFLTGTLEADVEKLMDKARHAEVVINGLDARGLYLNASAGVAYDGIGVLASGTGGTFFHNNNNMELGFRELGTAPETSYVLGFTPSDAADGSFHNLKVRLAVKGGYSVEARLGYTATAARADATDSAVSKLDAAVMASDTVADLPASFTWEQWAGPPAITMIVHLDFNRLHFKPNRGRRAQKLAIAAVLLDSHGNFVTGKRSVLELNLMDTTFERFAKSGFTTALTIKAPPGSYSVRAVAEDAMEGKLAAASGAVEVK
jgi:VWFA-related protein